MLAVFTGCFDLLRHAAILLFAAGVAAVDHDVRSRRDRAIMPNEMEVAVVHLEYLAKHFRLISLLAEPHVGVGIQFLPMLSSFQRL